MEEGKYEMNFTCPDSSKSTLQHETTLRHLPGNVPQNILVDMQLSAERSCCTAARPKDLSDSDLSGKLSTAHSGGPLSHS